MRPNLITATEANRSFSDILNKVYFQKQTFDIKRGKEVIAKIVPAGKTAMSPLKVKDLADFLQHLPHFSPEERDIFTKEIKEIRQQLPEVKQPWD
jgi:hypothetical protein